MGIDRYVSSDFVDGRGVVNGKIGNLYGIDIYVTSNCPVIETAADNAAGGAIRGAIMGHKDTMVMAEQQSVFAHRLSTSRSSWVLCTLLTVSTVLRYYVLRLALY
jgi:hypothetical protein